uniref:ARAD1D05148p n=1 Tax=Blastobotrys adeninivorans TaxID=409370 RepID=A0A060T897_BLAAD
MLRRAIAVVALVALAWFYTLYQYNLLFTAKRVSVTAQLDQTHYEWTVQKHRQAPDGIEKDLILVNGQFPGPTIQAKIGDTISVTVHNKLNESTSIHWHGIHQNGTNFMDGAVGITQCGIPPGESFTYRFTVDKAGTYWWHSHYELQRTDGMFGALIVDDDSDPYLRHYDEELVIMIHDHYFDSSSNVLEWYLSRESSGSEPVPDNGLINGRGVFDCSKLLNDKFNCSSEWAQNAHFSMVSGRRYRIRLINSSAMANFVVSIAGGEFDVIEADSTLLKRSHTKELPISAGQRYSLIYTARGKGQGQMIVEMDTDCFNYVNPYLDPIAAATITIQRGTIGDLAKDLMRRVSSKLSRFTKRDECLDVEEGLLEPLYDEPVPEADIQVIVYAKIMKLQRNNRAPYSFFNRTSWIPAIGSPNLLTQLELTNASITTNTLTGDAPTEKWGGHQMVVPVPLGSVVELIVNNGDESPHPFHLVS